MLRQLTALTTRPNWPLVIHQRSCSNQMFYSLVIQHNGLTNKVNLRILLILAGDIETNPGPIQLRGDKNICPCEDILRNVLYITCVKCEQKWHVRCVGLEGITEAPLKKLLHWNCHLCYIFPDKVRELRQKKE